MFNNTATQTARLAAFIWFLTCPDHAIILGTRSYAANTWQIRGKYEKDAYIDTLTSIQQQQQQQQQRILIHLQVYNNNNNNNNVY